MYKDARNTDTGARRIGESARGVGVSPRLLRAFERRYGLLRPIRSEGGFRLHTSDGAVRVSRMRTALDEGRSAAEAAGSALAQNVPDRATSFARACSRPPASGVAAAARSRPRLPARERHDVRGLIAFALLLRSYGWRILFLGADTRLCTLGETVATTEPRLVVASMDGALLKPLTPPTAEKASSACTPSPPGTRHPPSASVSAPLALTDEVTLVAACHVPRDAHDAARQHFDEAELCQLLWAITAINAWNRFAIVTRMLPGAYHPE